MTNHLYDLYSVSMQKISHLSLATQNFKNDLDKNTGTLRIQHILTYPIWIMIYIYTLMSQNRECGKTDSVAHCLGYNELKGADTQKNRC